MKSFLLFVLFIPFNIAAQESFPKNDRGEIVYEKTIEPKALKTLLFANSKKWIDDTFYNSKSLITTIDSEGGLIIGKASASIGVGAIIKMPLDYKIQINVKENKARLRIYDIAINTGVVVPLDEAVRDGKELTDKQRAKASPRIKIINDYFNNLLNSYSDFASKELNDDF